MIMIIIKAKRVRISAADSNTASCYNQQLIMIHVCSCRVGRLLLQMSYISEHLTSTNHCNRPMIIVWEVMQTTSNEWILLRSIRHGVVSTTFDHEAVMNHSLCCKISILPSCEHALESIIQLAVSATTLCK